MKKARPATPGLQVEYEFRGGVREKYAARYAKGTNVVVLDPDVAKFFPDSKSVNEALRAPAAIATRAKRGASRS